MKALLLAAVQLYLVPINGHQPPPALCLTGALYGQSNNQLLTIAWARRQAKSRQLELILSYDSGDTHLHQNWHRVFGKVARVVWKLPETPDECAETSNWEAMYWDMMNNRETTDIHEWPVPQPVAAVRDIAEKMHQSFVSEHGFCTTVHGRSFEFNPAFCMSTGHAPFQCREGLCDHSFSTTLARFRPYLANHTDPNQFLLLSDNQNTDYARSYAHYESGGDLFLQMWRMVVSDIHIGHPASSVDYVVWRWREANGYITDTSYMLPWACYNARDFPGSYRDTP